MLYMVSSVNVVVMRSELRRMDDIIRIACSLVSFYGKEIH